MVSYIWVVSLWGYVRILVDICIGMGGCSYGMISNNIVAEQHQYVVVYAAKYEYAPTSLIITIWTKSPFP